MRLKWECLRSYGRTAKRILSGLLVLQMLALLTLAACPPLHHALHPDSDSPDHHCLITTLAKGQLSGPELAPLIVPVILLAVCAVFLPDAAPRLLFPYRFASSRAPPRF